MNIRKPFLRHCCRMTVWLFICWLIPQGSVSGQVRTERIEVDFRNESLRNILEYIGQHTSCHFFYSENLIQDVGGITFSARRITVPALLKKLLSPFQLTFSIDKSLIIIKQKMVDEEKPMPVGSDFTQICGYVRDKSGECLPGVNVYVRHLPQVGATTDADGYYCLRACLADTVCFSSVGYDRKNVVIKDAGRTLNVVLAESNEYLDEVMIVGYGQQRAVSVIGAVSGIDIAEISRPVAPVSGMLAGRLTGLVGVQYSGEPGNNSSEFWIRGVGTFGANQKALILIDGVERDNLDDLVPSDIEHFSILKDATATAIYGARGGNGVVLINTRRGQPGPLKVNFGTKLSVETLPRLPDYLEAGDYMHLANEARIVRGESPVYSPDEYRLVEHRLDPDLYPDVHWQEEILKRSSLSSLSSLNLAGGTQILQYYLSGAVRTNNMIFKGGRPYKSSVDRSLYSFRSNLDIVPSRDLKIVLDLSAEYMKSYRPGGEPGTNIWQSLADATPMLAPVMYSNGYVPVYGPKNLMLPTTLLRETGYRQESSVNLQSRLKLEEKLDWLLRGLSTELTLAFDNRYSGVNQCLYSPDLYRAIDRKWPGGELVFEKRRSGISKTFSTEGQDRKSLYLEAKLNYSAVFRTEHRLDMLMLYNQRNHEVEAAEEIEAVPFRSQGIAGRMTYSFRDIYFSEFNFGYTGTENFPANDRFGFFPSIALGWVVSNYDSFHRRFPFFQLLKLRYSVGLVGNDKIINKRFPNLYYIDFAADGYDFGDFGYNHQDGVSEAEMGSDRIKWEIARKQNLGVDINIQNWLMMTVDWYQDHRKGIFMRRESLPDIVGVKPKPYGNWGEMRNWGVDGNMTLAVPLPGIKCELSGTFVYTKDRIEKYEERTDYSYQKNSGMGNGALRGLVALGLFRNEEDVRYSPSQFGKLWPGDIKYKDVNGDGIVSDDDVVVVGHNPVPKLQYGMTLNLGWKNFYARVFFRGASKVNFFYGGNGFFPYAEGNIGNVLKVVGQPAARWTPAGYSGTVATENPDARFPRLTYGDNQNNNRPSTFWLADGSYLRFKDLEIGYFLPECLLKKIRLKLCRVSFIGDNLCVWDKVKLWDPEQASSNGGIYPIPRSYTFALQVGF